MILNIPLSGYHESVVGYYHTVDINSIHKDTDNGYRVIGYKSGTGFANPTMQYTLALDIPIPIKPGALNSAQLSFSFLSGLPQIISTGSQTFTYDFRQTELNKLPRFINVPIGATTTTSFVPSNNYDVVLATTKYSGIYFNVSTSTIPYLNVTPLVAYHTNKSNWQKNNYVTIIISGVPTGIGGGGAIEVPSLYLHLDYKAVAPNEPTAVSAAESAYKQISVTWLTPTDNGDATITKYIIQSGYSSGEYSLVSNWSKVAESTGLSVIIDNLPVDTPLKFRVAAINSGGTGVYSASSNTVTLSNNIAPVTALSFNDANYTRIRLRRATSGEWRNFNPILAVGEIAYETDTYRLKVGNGISFWTGLNYTRIDQSTITFPSPPDTILRIASSENDALGNDRVIVNLSQSDRLNIIGKEGVVINYDENFNKITFSTDKLYNPINSGTIYNPTTTGTPGSLLYDNDWLYFCVANNFWNRSPIDKQWTDFAKMTVSHSGLTFSSLTSLIFSGQLINIKTNADPYPALAGRPLTNSGFRDFIIETINSQNVSLWFTFRGGTNTNNPMKINSNDIHGIAFNGSPIKSLSAGTGALPGFVSAPSGLTYNVTYHLNKFYADDCAGYPDGNGLYSYRNGLFLTNCWNTPLVYNNSSYYSQSNFSGNYFRHPNGHSKIIGFCLDGYPIYGPYGHSGLFDSNSPIILMRSSYSGLATDTHRPVDWKYFNKIGVNDIEYDLLQGAFIEDFIYISGYGTLDEFNGRFCTTPEFPSGTYAYFLTFTNSSLSIPEFPYIFGTGTKQQRQS